MSSTNTRKLPTDYTQAWPPSEGDVDRFASFLMADFVYESVPTGVVTHGQAEFREFFSLMFAAFSNIEMNIVSLVIEGNHAVMEWTLSAVHEGVFLNIPPTHNHVSMRGVFLILYDSGPWP